MKEKATNPVRLTPEAHKALKKEAVLSDKSMSELILEMIKERENDIRNRI